MAQQAGLGQMLIVTDPPRHTRMRQIINKRFTKAALAPQEPHIRAIATEILDSVTPQAQCDFVVDVAAKLPTAVICEMMGIPKTDWDLMFKVANMSIGSQDPEYQIDGVFFGLKAARSRLSTSDRLERAGRVEKKP
jgi:cholest-4-en-3-one 26-monooxygenase